MKILFGVAYVAFCMVQIAIIDVYQGTVCMIGWVKNWAVFRAAEHFQALLNEFAMEVQQEVFGVGPTDDASETGSTMAPATMVGGIWQAPSSNGGTWSSSASSSASSSVGVSTAGSSSWAMVSGGLMNPVPEEEEKM